MCGKKNKKYFQTTNKRQITTTNYPGVMQKKKVYEKYLSSIYAILSKNKFCQNKKFHIESYIKKVTRAKNYLKEHLGYDPDRS